MFTQTLFIGKTVFPPFTRTLKRVHESIEPPYSYAWFCPECIELWARAIIPKQRVYIFEVLCEAHTDKGEHFHFPGSILISWDHAFNNALPIEVWKREFFLHERLLDRKA